MAPAADNEDELIRRVQAGEEAACAELVARFGGRLFALVRRFCPNEDDAREALQEAFASAFRGIAKFDGDSRLGTWLHTIAVNAALMKLRRARARPERSLDDLLPRFIADGHHAVEVPDWSPTATALAEREETRRQVRAAIAALPEPYRIVLVARDIEGMDTEATAAALGISIALVKTRLHRARQALRKLLEPHFQGAAP